MRVYVFIDTNVLLHYKFFRDVDWAAALGVSEVFLVFAPVVLGELDHHKWSGSRREKSRAKAVLKALDDLGLSAAPASVRAGVSIMAVAAEPEDGLFGRHRLQPTVQDDRLLASLLGFIEECASGDRVLLLSADAGLRVKARARQIEVVAPDDGLAQEDELDETERQLAAANRELTALRNAAPDLRLTIEGETHIEGEVRLVTPFGAGALGRLLEDWRSKHPHVSATADTLNIFGGQAISLKGFSGLPGFLSAEDAAAHNATVDRVFKEYELYVRNWPSIVNQYRRSMEFTFVLENSGTAPADDVYLQLWTEAEGVWLEDLPKVPRAPGMPKRRDLFDPGRLLLPHFDTSSIRVAEREVKGPDVTEAGRLEYWAKRVTHHVPRELPAVHFRFSADDNVASFSINYRLVAANIREPKTDVLHVKLSVAKTDAPPLPGPPTKD